MVIDKDDDDDVAIATCIIYVVSDCIHYHQQPGCACTVHTGFHALYYAMLMYITIKSHTKGVLDRSDALYRLARCVCTPKPTIYQHDVFRSGRFCRFGSRAASDPGNPQCHTTRAAAGARGGATHTHTPLMSLVQASPELVRSVLQCTVSPANGYADTRSSQQRTQPTKTQPK